LLNYVLGFLCFWVIFLAGYPGLTTKVGGVLDGFGAKEAGLHEGDRVTSIDGKKVVFWDELQNIIQQKKTADKVLISVLRDNKIINLEVRIKEKQVNDPLGQKRSVGLLGIIPADEIIKVRHSLFKSFVLGIDKTMELTYLTYKGLWRMITGRISVRESVTGPLGIFYITSKATSMGVIAVLHLIAALSISLALFNLLPLPVLDGGHILFLGIEKIRGKALSIKTERIITKTGLTLIITLALLVTYNDILRLFEGSLSKFFK